MRKQLELLATQKDPESRSRLVKALVAEYAHASRQEPSLLERELFSQIVLSVFNQLDRSSRYELVVRLAKTNRISTELADRLAREDYELSEPVIESSPMISQEMLLEIAQKGNEQQRYSTTKRHDLSEKITDALIARGPRKIIHAILKNLTAPISIKASIALLIFANTETDTLAAIAHRAIEDEEFYRTQVHIMETQCPLMPPPLRKAFETKTLSTLAKHFNVAEESSDITIDGVSYSKHEASMQTTNGELSFDEILLNLCNEKRFDAVYWLIAKKLNIGVKRVTDTFKSKSDMVIMMILLETGISPKTYKNFLQIQFEEKNRNPSNIPELVSRFRNEKRRIAKNRQTSKLLA